MPELSVVPSTALDNSASLLLVPGVHETNAERCVNLIIQRKDDHFRLKVVPGANYENVFPADARECDVPITDGELWGAVQTCRDAWRANVVDAQDAAGYVLQRGWDLGPPPLGGAVIGLGPAAVAGSHLFDAVFLPNKAVAKPQEYAALRKVRDAILGMAAGSGLCFRITSDDFYAPWNLMYTRELKDPFAGADAVPEGFLGYEHVVEHGPETATRGTDVVVDGKGVRVVLYLDDGIGACNTVVEQSLAAYRPTIVRDRWTKGLELLNDLGGTPLDDHVLYFCCHATVSGSTAQIQALQPSFALTDRASRITPGHLIAKLQAREFRNGPVVFLNACETAQMNSLFYKGFVPIFMSRRASAFIGTQTEIPAVFAGEFARRFFERFFQGGPANSAGKVIFDLRREFVKKHGNPLGMLYSLYTGADACLPAAVPRA